MSKKLIGLQGKRHPTKWKLHLIDLCDRREWVAARPRSNKLVNLRPIAKWAIHLDKQGYLL